MGYTRYILGDTVINSKYGTYQVKVTNYELHDKRGQFKHQQYVRDNVLKSYGLTDQKYDSTSTMRITRYLPRKPINLNQIERQQNSKMMFVYD